MMKRNDWADVYLMLILFAETIELPVLELPFTNHDGLIADNRIGIRRTLPTTEEKAKTLAHEISHNYLLRHDPRNLIENPDPDEERRADYMGEALIDFARFAKRHGMALPTVEPDGAKHK